MRVLACAVAVIAAASISQPAAQQKRRNPVIDLWTKHKTAFGVFVPNENRRQRGQPPLYTKTGGERLASNALYDFVLLDLEDAYDSKAISSVAEGLRSSVAFGRKALIVRIPPIDRDGNDLARSRVKEALDLGADGVTIPHVQNVEQANLAIRMYQDAKADVWSPENPDGEILSILIVEDPGAVAMAREIANLRGYSGLACGIGTLTQALNGDRGAAEAGVQSVLRETKRVGLMNIITTTADDVESRVRDGFSALISYRQNPDAAIRMGRSMTGR